MMAWIGAAWLVVGFLICLRIFSVVDVSRRALLNARESWGVIRNPDLDDDDKETLLQRHAGSLWLCFFKLLLGGAAALLLPAAVIWCFERLGWMSLDETFAVVVSPVFIVMSSLAIVTTCMKRKR